MKRFATVLLAAGFAITLVGCTPPEVKITVDTSASTNTTEAASSALTLVTLKVPNMF
jgi:hypothetical protein